MLPKLLTWSNMLKALHHPGAAIHTLKRLAENVRYERARVVFLKEITGADERSIRHFIKEVHTDAEFIEALRTAYRRNSLYTPSDADFMLGGLGGSMFFYPVIMYALTRLIQPETVVETGGTPGKSSAFILRAMERNERGRLYTIDFPPLKYLPPHKLEVSRTHKILPEGKGSGWIVPDELKNRHELIIGKSSEFLPPLLESLQEMNIFMHDSEHSYENMIWEYETAWPYIRSGGLLLSDDIRNNAAFSDFCKGKGIKAIELPHFGAILKRTDSARRGIRD